jgi:hypothetical protein
MVGRSIANHDARMLKDVFEVVALAASNGGRKNKFSQEWDAMLTSPVIFFYGFFILLVFVIGVAPTDFWMRIGSSITGAAARGRHARVAAQFARATASASFTADVSYVPNGIAFAFDRARALLFVGDNSNTPAEDLVPVTAIRAHGMGVITGGFTDDNYVDLFPAASPVSRWRVSCGEDVETAHAIANVLSALGIPKA